MIASLSHLASTSREGKLEAVGAATRATLAETTATRSLLLAAQRRDAHLASVLRSQAAQIAALKRKVRTLQD